ncbi:57.7 kda trp-asp repeats containing protein [Trichosporon asahii var. asahii CBS 2479]|uniref:57.7 kDa trp-asp repeats containing protein n=1 Tax=Trichosporon asahii var. asahii (strain ATCC 90039 / CBS 2479 / JCM 2466 / KCTC 7840 / NBRC 103889/ NCYC 2677 / UAMH 7654) TaxID=1186058 RepID=J6FA81_TRIAS|nr:57.7 kda trp-asp repeats containing protein [Trichosporon asahii var. asahii CBS 2479]EJT52127.1 57.7 kda trp-asp repeats containing protein [Trichosporon asahii var. asahii CBS 2479]
MDFHPLQALPTAPRATSSINPHSRHFHSFRHPLFIKQNAPVTHIHFSPARPHRYAVTSSTRVLVYAPKTGKVVKTVSRFKDTARCGEFRKDGKLMSRPEDIQGTQPVLSGSDDTTVRLWDVSTQECLTTLEGHTDYVRAAVFTAPHLILSSSYDSTIKLWDVRAPAQSNCTMTMRHGGAPVEDVLAFPSGGVAMSAGGPILRVWDLAMGRCVRALSNHQKTITTLAFDGSKGRVLTGSLDTMVKAYDVEEWKVVHTMRYPAPILSLAVSPDDTHIAAGMSDGTLSVRRRDAKAKEVAEEEAKQAAIANGAYEYFADMEAVFGRGHVKAKGAALGPVIGPADEFRVETRRKERLRDYDKYLKSFKYSAALDAALKKTVRPTTTFALILELVQRDALRIALSGRDDVTLEPLLSFLTRHVTDPRFGEACADVVSVLLDLYSPQLDHSPLVDELLAKLNGRVERELAFQRELFKLRGALDMTLAQAAMSRLQS